jgi:hypothetical protein
MSQTSFTCLCCGKPVTQPGKPMTAEQSARAYRVLRAQGHSRAGLLTLHRGNLEYTAPGFVEWIERETT